MSGPYAEGGWTAEPEPEDPPKRHVPALMSGYMSMRCLHDLDGCDDQACICSCHEDDEADGE